MNYVCNSKKAPSGGVDNSVDNITSGRISLIGTNLCGRRQKLSLAWKQRAAVMFFLHHPNLGRGNLTLTCNIWNINIRKTSVLIVTFIVFETEIYDGDQIQ